MIEAFTRFTASLSRAQRSAGKARVFTFLNAKGGVGATTTAVNTALPWNRLTAGRTRGFRPDWSCLAATESAASIHVVDALQNLHRMDVSLLEGLMTHYRTGLHLLAVHSNRRMPSHRHRTGASVRFAREPIQLCSGGLFRPRRRHHADDL